MKPFWAMPKKKRRKRKEKKKGARFRCQLERKHMIGNSLQKPYPHPPHPAIRERGTPPPVMGEVGPAVLDLEVEVSPIQITRSSGSGGLKAAARSTSRELTRMSVPVRCFQRLVTGFFMRSRPVCSSCRTSR